MSSGIKRIKGREYIYCTYHINGKRHDIYCGPASDPDARTRALKLEIKHSKQQINHFTQKVKELETQLRKLTQ